MRMGSFLLCIVAMYIIAATAHAETCGAVLYPGTPPGAAAMMFSPTDFVLKNAVLEYAFQWNDDGFSLRFKGLNPATDIATGNTPLLLKLTDGRILGSADFVAQGNVEQVQLPMFSNAHRLAERFAGWQVSVPWRSRDGNIEVLFTATLRNDSNYVIQQVSLTASDEDLDIDTITLLDLHVEGAQLAGKTQGAPVMAGSLFFAYENPMSESTAENGRVVCAMQRENTLKAGTTLVQSCVLGTTPPNQARRGFLYYVERERAHPYRPFLHYNSWYDIAWGDRKFNEAQSLEAITLFGEELYEKRGVALQSFVFDDGWDDNKTLWQFH